MKKRTISLLLCLVMILTAFACMPLTASAWTYTFSQVEMTAFWNDDCTQLEDFDVILDSWCTDPEEFELQVYYYCNGSYQDKAIPGKTTNVMIYVNLIGDSQYSSEFKTATLNGIDCSSKVITSFSGCFIFNNIEVPVPDYLNRVIINAEYNSSRTKVQNCSVNIPGAKLEVKYASSGTSISQLTPGKTQDIGFYVTLPDGYSWPSPYNAYWNGVKQTAKIKTTSMLDNQRAFAFKVTVPNPHSFSDVKSGSWYNDSVQFVYENNLMNGTTSTEFNPNGTLTREMFVTILGRYANIDTTLYKGVSFSDVKAGQWYSPYVEWAYKNGVTSGMGDGTFGVGQAVSREQMAVFIANFVRSKGLALKASDNPVSSFADDAVVSSWAKTGLDIMRKTGIITGDDAGHFSPKNNATRAQAAAIFQRLVKCRNLTDAKAVVFGAYEQDNVSKNGKEAIEWKVLHNTDGQMLLISKYILDSQAYENNFENIIGWDKCSLRSWLNNTFKSQAFSSSEQQNIIESLVKQDVTDYTAWFNGGDTKDQLFLLSWVEIGQYFKHKKHASCQSTAYARAQQGKLIQYDKDKTVNCWWLRTRGDAHQSIKTDMVEANFGCFIPYENKDISSAYDSNVNNSNIGVRPSMWISY